MKLSCCVLLLLPTLAAAQYVRPQAASPAYNLAGSSAPSGACQSNQIYIQTGSTPAVWLCGAGTWTASSSGGGFTAGGDLQGTSTSQIVASTHLASPLPVAQGGAYAAQSWESGASAVSSSNPAAANIVKLWGKEIQLPLQVSHLAFYVTTADATGLYSFGVYGPLSACSGGACPLVAHTAPASYASAGLSDIALVEGTVTLQPGIYFFGYTGNASALTVVVAGAASSQRQAYLYQSATVASTGGAQPATIPAPSLAVVMTTTTANILPYFFLSQQ